MIHRPDGFAAGKKTEWTSCEKGLNVFHLYLHVALLCVTDSVSISSCDERYWNANAHLAPPAPTSAGMLCAEDAIGARRTVVGRRHRRRGDCGRRPNDPQKAGKIHAWRGRRDRKHNQNSRRRCASRVRNSIRPSIKSETRVLHALVEIGAGCSVLK